MTRWRDKEPVLDLVSLRKLNFQNKELNCHKNDVTFWPYLLGGEEKQISGGNKKVISEVSRKLPF